MRNNQTTVTTTSNFNDLESAECSFDEDGIGHIMDILSNMYTNALDAVLREYPANGYDSHVRAGVTRPVEVTLPTSLQPTLLVQDYGLGLSKDEIFNVYSKYGKSTKNDTDDEVGGFGIGAKSAFTLAQQFIVTGVKDGQKTVAIFALNEFNRGTATVAWEGPTDEPNGVLISLGVDDVEDCRAAAERVYRTWPRGSVLVDGQEPTSVFDTATWITDEAGIVENCDGTVYVCAGPVAYPVDSKMWEKVVKRVEDIHKPAVETLVNWSSQTASSLFFKVGIKDVKVAPSREALRDSPKTMETLQRLVTELSGVLVNGVQQSVAAAPSKFAANRVLMTEISSYKPFEVKRKSLTYKGVHFRHDVLVPLTVFFLGDKSWRSSTQVVREDKSMTVTPASAEKVLVINNLAPEDFGKVRRFAKRFLENSEYSYIMLSEASAASYDWFQYGVDTAAATWSIEEYRAALKDMRPATVRATSGPSYTTGVGVTASRDLSDRDSLEEIIEEGKDIVIFSDRSPGSKYHRRVLADYTVVVLLGTQSEAALRKRVEADGTVEVVDLDVPALVEEAKKADRENVTEDERWAFHAMAWINEHNYGYNAIESWTRWFDFLGDDATHPTLREVHDTITEVREIAASVDRDRLREVTNLLDEPDISEVVDFIGVDVLPEFPKTFPLLGQMSSYGLRHTDEALRQDIIEYFNNKV